MTLHTVSSPLSVTSWQHLGDWFATDGLRILVTLVAAGIVRWIAQRSIDRIVASASRRSEENHGPGRASRVLRAATGLSRERHAARIRTLGSLLRSLVTFVVVLVTLLTVMALVGIPLAPVLASARVGGVALGIGAQSLVRDFLSGIFMIVEDQYGVGDVVDTGTAIGTVEDVTLRITRLRDGDGVTWYVRNGEIVRVGNRSQGWSTATVDIPVAYRERLESVVPVIEAALAAMDAAPEWGDRMLDPPQVLGVESVASGAVTIRTTARCAPGEHFAVQREMRVRIKEALDAAGIQGPPLPGDMSPGL